MRCSLQKQRKELKRSEANIEKDRFTKTKQLVIDADFSEDITPSKQDLTMQNVISFLQNLEHNNPSLAKLQTENDVLQAQLTSLQKTNHELETKLAVLTKTTSNRRRLRDACSNYGSCSKTCFSRRARRANCPDFQNRSKWEFRYYLFCRDYKTGMSLFN